MKSLISAIFKAFIVSLSLIAQMHFAFAQVGILPNAESTFLDSNGNPLSGGQVYYYVPSTTTPKTTWQDVNQTTPNSNPVVLDAAGRALVWGSGNYRQQVFDKNNNLIWDQVTSANGSGSGTPSTQTGDGDLVGTIKPWAGISAPNQYAFTYGQQLSRTTYASLFTAITSTQSVFCTSGNATVTGLTDTTNFWIGMTVEIGCVLGGVTTVTGKTSSTVTLAATPNVSATSNATFFPWGNGNGTTTFNLPDLRGVVPVGNNIMGGVAGSNISSTYYGSTNPNSAGAFGGSQSYQLAQNNLPNIVPTFTGNSPGQNFLVSLNLSATQLGNLSSYNYVNSGNATAAATPSGTISSINGNVTEQSFSLVQPSKTVNFIIKITPDANSAAASGVTSLGGMTGSIACGGGLLCTGNVISSGSVNPAALSTANDTNITITASGAPATALLQAVTLTAGFTGTLASGRLNSNVVQGVTNDTNVIGSISAQNLTLGWSGVLAIARGGTGQSNATGARSSSALNIDESTGTGDANYSILSTDRSVYHTALTAARTDTIPASASVNAGQHLSLYDPAGVVSNTNTITLQRSGSDTINGGNTFVALNTAYGVTDCIADGISKWTCSQLAGGGGGGGVSNVTIAGGANVTVTGTCSITISGTCTINQSNVSPPNGRLTLQANTPVMTSSQTSQTTLRYDCYNGSGVPYFDGTRDQVDTISSCEVTDAMVSAASAGQVVSGNVYDVWWVHGGANRICLAMSASTGGGGGWSADTGGSNTARGTGYTQLDRSTRGYTTNKNSITNCFNAATNYGPISANQGTYLGTVYSSANGQISYTFGASASGGTAALLGVWNMYNRVSTTTNIIDSGTSYTYASATIRQSRASAGNQIQFVSGLQEDGVSFSNTTLSVTAGVLNSFLNVGVGFDSTSAFGQQPASISTPASTQMRAPNSNSGVWNVGPGFHTLSSNESSDGTNSSIFDFQSLNNLSATIKN